MIQADNISFVYGEKLLLQQVTASIPLGEVTVVLGPNGAGKSTLLKCLTGIHAVTNGTIFINKKEVSEYSIQELSRLRAVLSQSVQVNFPFTAFEIVAMGRSPYDQDVDVMHYPNISHRVMEVVDVVHLKNRVFPTLSGGEQQRVQLARVLAQLWEMRNTYLFLDEPTSALDLKHQHQLMTYVQKMAKQYQMGVCIVMHDLHLAFRYADKVLLMKNGKLFAAGETKQVLTKQHIEHVFEVSADMVFDSHL